MIRNVFVAFAFSPALLGLVSFVGPAYAQMSERWVTQTEKFLDQLKEQKSIDEWDIESYNRLVRNRELCGKRPEDIRKSTIEWFKCIEAAHAKHAGEVRGNYYLPFALKLHNINIRTLLIVIEIAKILESIEKNIDPGVNGNYIKKLFEELYVLDSEQIDIIKKSSNMYAERLRYYIELFRQIDAQELDRVRRRISELDIEIERKKIIQNFVRERYASEKSQADYRIGISAIFEGLKLLSGSTQKNSPELGTYIMNGKIVNCQILANGVRSCNWID